MQRIDDIFIHLNQPGSPGCAVAVVHDGKIIYQNGFGLGSIENNVPITPKSVFNIGSMSKQFTAFAIALLANKGKLSLDHDIRQYLPELPDIGELVTIRHLIHHTSGIRNSFPALLSLAEWRDIDATSTDDVFKLLQMQRGLNFKPGDKYEYSNSNYILLALIVAKISGKSFGAFMQESVFTPLEMHDTTVNDDFFRIIPNRTLGYYEERGKTYLAPLTDTVIGATNIYTTVLDLAKWILNFTTHQIGGEKVAQQMLELGVLNDGSTVNYAFGLMLGEPHQYHGWKVIEHGGSQGGYTSHLMMLPDKDFSVIVLCNYFLWSAREFAEKIVDIFFPHTPEQQAQDEEIQQPFSSEVAVEESILKSLTGKYFSDELGAFREVTVKKEKLYYGEHRMVPISEHQFYFEVDPLSSIEFQLSNNGVPKGLNTVTPQRTYSYRKIEDTGKEINLADYIGKYYSPELDVYWVLFLEKDLLQVKRRKYITNPLTNIFADTFTEDWQPIMGYPTSYTLQFQRDEKNSVIGFILSGNNIFGLRFEKSST